MEAQVSEVRRSPTLHSDIYIVNTTEITTYVLRSLSVV
jgi:hypothetical protein